MEKNGKDGKRTGREKGVYLLHVQSEQLAQLRKLPGKPEYVRLAGSASVRTVPLLG